MATKKNTTINGKEYYRIRRTIDGKVKAFYGTSKHDAEQKYRRYLEQLAKEGHKQNKETASIHDRAWEFIDNSLSVSQRYAQSTIKRYRMAYTAHIQGTWFDDLTASAVRASDIQRLYNGLNVSASGISQINKFMTAFWKWMVLNEYAQNIKEAVEIPRKPESKRSDGIIVWEEDEIRAILHGLDASTSPSVPVRMVFLVKLLIYTGVRIGEAMSLRYSDFRDGFIHIERQYYEGEIKKPKCNSSRVIPMHDALIEPLKKHKAWQEAEMKEKGYKTEYLFTTSKGTHYINTNIRIVLNRYYDSIGVPHKKIHAYRSTFCTQLCRCDVPLEVASKLLGHKSLEVTARHYQLIKNDTIEDAIQKLKY